MSIVYIPTSRLAVAVKLTQALLHLKRPPQYRQAADATSRLFAVRKMLDGSYWLEVVTEYSIPIHAEATIDEIAPILQPWIDDGKLPADTLQVMAAQIEAHKGQRMTVWEFFPAFFQEQAKTRSELVSAGLLASLPQ